MDHVPVHDGRERADVLDLVWRHREVVPPDAARFGVPRGWLRLRASRSNLDTAVALDIDSAKTPETWRGRGSRSGPQLLRMPRSSSAGTRRRTRLPLTDLQRVMS